MNKKQLLVILAVLGLIGFMTLGVSNARDTQDKLKLRDVQLQDRSNKIKLLQLKEVELEKRIDQGAQDAEKIKQLETEKQQLDQERQRLEGELQAKLQRKEAERVAAAERRNNLVNAVTGTSRASAAPVSSNAAKAYIYMRESGNNPSAVNSIGCRGLGQACPGSKLPCGADYACQDAWFTQYAMQRYGSWEAAKMFWDQNHWW